MTRAAVVLLLLILPFLLPSDAPAPPLGAQIYGLYQIHGGICTDGQFIVNNNGVEWTCGDPAATTTSGAILDLSDDGSNESTGLAEIATNEATPTIFTESAPDKLLIRTDLPWPTSSALAADPDNCSAGEAAGGIVADGTAEACVDPILETELDTETELEAQLTDVINVYTDNDGALDDDDLSDNNLADLANVNADANAADNEILIGDGSEYRGVNLPVCNEVTEKLIFDGSVLSCEADTGGEGTVDSSNLAELLDVGASANHADDQVIVGNGTTYEGVALPDCNTSTQKLHYDPGTNSFSCQSDSGGDISANNIDELADVNEDADAADDEVMVGDGTEYRGILLPTCNASTEKFHYDPTTNSFSCETDANSGSAAGLDANFEVDNTINSAACESTPLELRREAAGNDLLRLCIGSDEVPLIQAICNGGGCDQVDDIPDTKSLIVKGDGTEFERLTAAGVHSYSGAGQPTKTVYFPALALEVDGTNCVYGDSVQVNSGPRVTPINCADSGSSVFEGNVSMLKTGWNAGTVRFTLHAHHGTTEAITFAGDWSAMCRGDSDPINSTWGTGVQGDLSIDTANDVEQQTSAAVTPDGTCAAGDHLFFRFVVDAATFSANAANTNVLGVSLHYETDTRNGDDES